LISMLGYKTYKKGLLIMCLLLVGLFIVGCRPSSKAGYESAMKEILKTAKADLGTAGINASGNPAAPAANDKKVNELLEKIKDQIDGINPPDDLFSGHSDIKEFVELTIESRKGQAAPSKSKTGQPTQPPMDFALINAARQALDRARRELPFLDYELIDAFGGVLRPTFSPNPSSGFGAPSGFGVPSGMGAPGNQTQQSPIRITPSGSPIKINK